VVARGPDLSLVVGYVWGFNNVFDDGVGKWGGGREAACGQSLCKDVSYFLGIVG